MSWPESPSFGTQSQLLCMLTYITDEEREGVRMGQRSDAKQKMVQAARQLIRERGYGATAFSDVLTLSGAPRGSVDFHFPGGKAQLGMEAAEAHAHEQVEIIDRAAEEASSAAQLIERYVDLGREGMVAGNYGRGCGVARREARRADRSATPQDSLRLSTAPEYRSWSDSLFVRVPQLEPTGSESHDHRQDHLESPR